MNNNKIRKYQIHSTLFIFLLGTLLHFSYDMSNNNTFFSFFSAINESTWEHLKLIFFPMLLTILFGIIYFKNNIPNFLCSKTIGLLVSIIFTIVFFYTYTGIIGKNIAFIDISSFFISITLGEFISYLLIINKFKCNKTISIIILSILLFLFIVFTYNPPKIALFKDPINHTYGIKK